jgi:hypothetical protein
MIPLPPPKGHYASWMGIFSPIGDILFLLLEDEGGLKGCDQNETRTGGLTEARCLWAEGDVTKYRHLSE